MKKILTIMLILAMAITAVGCAKSDPNTLQTSTAATVSSTEELPDTDKTDVKTYIIVDRYFYSVEWAFQKSEVIVRGTCRAIDNNDAGIARDYLFDVTKVYCGEFSGSTLHLRESNEGKATYKIGEEYYLSLNICNPYYLDSEESESEGYYMSYYDILLPVFNPEDHCVFGHTSLSYYAQEETVSALSSPDTAAKYFSTRRFSELSDKEPPRQNKAENFIETTTDDNSSIEPDTTKQ